MATKEDIKKEDADESTSESTSGETEGSESSSESESSESSESESAASNKMVRASASSDDDAGAAADRAEELAIAGGGPGGPVAAPTQLGHRRFVYAAYFAGAIGIAFLLSKVVDIAWGRLAMWKPMIGEPREELVMAGSALLGAIAAFYYWRRTRARQLAEQVAEELSKVTWPSRKEVTNSTFVVIVATLASTVFFALMDRFWGFVTNLVYGT